jgi:hypothetical protein
MIVVLKESLKKACFLCLLCLGFAPTCGNEKVTDSKSISQKSERKEDNMLSYAKAKVYNIAKVLTYTVCFIGTSYAARGIIKSISDAINMYLLKKVQRDMYKYSVQSHQNRYSNIVRSRFAESVWPFSSLYLGKKDELMYTLKCDVQDDLNRIIFQATPFSLKEK